MSQKLKELLIAHEGLKKQPYRDTVNKLTIGVGRNLDDVGITVDEAMYLLDNDIANCRSLATRLPWFEAMDSVRQDVVVSMIFNLGYDGFKKFAKTIALLAVKNYTAASEEMLKSHWARQVGNRAVVLSKMMKDGVYDK